MVIRFVTFLFRCFAGFWRGSDADLEFCVAFFAVFFFAGVVPENLFVKVAMDLRHASS